ncbi:hypothetical protein CEXT_46471 [Caerostris extrusa]|uniref:Uncharacterized protein n=1 Tax=Caerostris extrusa TaxID=172846 RepID=A0AAV4MSA6_CAEEX|nr:hypothetical protein CEXT_46471 [Caerostris extrusa]
MCELIMQSNQFCARGMPEEFRHHASPSDSPHPISAASTGNKATSGSGDSCGHFLSRDGHCACQSKHLPTSLLEEQRVGRGRGVPAFN